MGRNAKLKRLRKLRTGAVLELYVQVAAPVFRERFIPNCCLNGTRVTLEVMKMFGIKAEPLATHAIAMNEVWWKFIQDSGGSPPQNEEEAQKWQAAGGWAVGIVGDVDGSPGYGGHLVAIVDGKLVDSAAGAFNRPQKSISVASIVVAPTTAGFLAGTRPLFLAEDGVASGTALSYWARRTDRQYETFPGFQPHEANLAIAKEIYLEMQQRIAHR